MAGTGEDHGSIGEGDKASTKIEGKKARKNPSLVSLAMARTASCPAGVSSMSSKDLIPGLYKGVLLDDFKVKFWIDEELHEHCFMVVPRGLGIPWNNEENAQYWSWRTYQEDCLGGHVDMYDAKLEDTCWLELWGSLPSIMLSPMTTYEAVFKIMKTEDNYGWDCGVPLSFTLVMPNGTRQTRSEDFEVTAKEEWFEYPFGEFVASPEILGTIKFSISLVSSNWKRGLVIRGVIFRPKSKK